MNCCCSLSSPTMFTACNTPVLASLADDHSLNSPPPSSSTRRPSVPAKMPTAPRLRRTRAPDQRPKKRTELFQPSPEKPTVIQIEKAIGTGVFRDNDPLDFDERRSVLDGIIPGSSRKVETAVERKLRETGEWIVSQSERRSNSAGKGILVAMFQWLLPSWVLLLLVTSGVVKLPVDIPLLNDLIM